MTNKTARAISLAGLLFLVLITVGYFAYTSMHGVPINPAAVSPAPNELPISQTTTTPQDSNRNVVSEYENASFRVVDIITNPFGAYPNDAALYVVTKRGVNDDACGGAYNAGKCYFFLESNYYNGPVKKYVGAWGGHFSTYTPGQTIFINADTVRFNAFGGDAGASIAQQWKLNLSTGTTSLVRQRRDSGPY